MKNKDTHTITQILRQILASALLILVLLSSCSVKRGVKVLFDVPMKTEQTGALGHQADINHRTATCVKCADVQVVASDSYDQSIFKNLSPAVFISLVFSLLLLAFFTPKAKTQYNLPRLGFSIPKYLLFSKLLFYDIQ